MVLLGTLLIIIVIIALCWAYRPGVKLFFRNDGWEALSVVAPMLDSFNGMLGFVKGTKHYYVKHFYPLGNLAFYIKFKLCGNSFRRHFLFSFIFHLINVVLVYIICLDLSSSCLPAIVGAILFGFSPLIVDMVVWPLMSFQIVCTSAILASIYLHPVFNDFGSLGLVGFYVTVIAATILFETGLLATLIAIAIYVINGHTGVNELLILVIPFLLYFIGRILVNGTLGIYSQEKKVDNIFTGIYFIGICKSICNLVNSMGKLLFGLFAAKFKLKITDTLYILKPDIKEPSTVLAGLLLFYLFYSLKVFISDPLTSVSLKYYCLLFPVIICLHFIMVSFSIIYPKQNHNIAHQLPRHFYFPSSILSMVVVVILAVNQPYTYFFIMLAVFVIINGAFVIREQISMLKPFTDNMREAVDIFKETGKLPDRGIRKCADDIRLDWSFNEESIKAYLSMEKREG